MCGETGFAIRAVRAAAAMQDSFRALADEQRGAVGATGLRVAVNTGEVVASDEAEIIGDPVNVAARLQEQGRDGDVVVGAASKRQMVTNPERTVYGAKRLIGRKANDRDIQDIAARLPYAIVASKNGDAWVDIEGTPRSPQEISAHVLAKMKRVAEDYLGETITEAVVTVPAYFDAPQVEATRRAGEIAGLEVLEACHQPANLVRVREVAREEDHACRPHPLEQRPVVIRHRGAGEPDDQGQ